MEPEGGLTVGEYLREIEEKRAGKPEQVKDGIEIYVGLWKKALEKGVVESQDRLGDALEKLERVGGLYAAAEE